MNISAEQICSVLALHEPTLLLPESNNAAAVALILVESESGLQVLMIERAIKDSDPWSGQIAFPGGRLEPSDANAQAAAERETLEEVGVDLSGARLLGRLDDLRGRRGGRRIDLAIACFVYSLPQCPLVTPNCEVGDTLWVPLNHLLDDGRHIGFEWAQTPARKFNAVKLEADGGRVLWGLTYRFMESFFSLLGYQIPPAEILSRS